MRKSRHFRAIVSRGVFFSLIWWVLTNGVVASWWIGVPAVSLAVFTSMRLLAPLPLSWYAVLKFVPHFLRHSLLGGLDVARRVFHPGMPLSPEIHEYPLRLPAGLPQVVMVNTISLLPGTLSAGLSENVLKVHVLDGQKDFLSELEVVEKSVARMFGAS